MKDKCTGCVMVKNRCILLNSITELVPNCPCSTCLVKMICTYDDTCDLYSEHMDKLVDDRYKERVFEYDTKYNPV